MRTLNEEQIENLREGGKRLVEILRILKDAAKPGANLLDIEALAQKEASRAGGIPSFKGFHGYPAASCLCVNDGIVHCIPIDYQLKEGDILTIDMGLYYNGIHTDSAITLVIGGKTTDPHIERLLKGAYLALRSGVDQVGPEATVGDISAAIDKIVRVKGLTAFKQFVGHQIGAQLHGDILIPNFASKGKTPKLEVGMALAIEPILGLGEDNVIDSADGWSTITADGKPAVQFEETVLVTENGYEIITPIDTLVDI